MGLTISEQIAKALQDHLVVGEIELQQWACEMGCTIDKAREAWCEITQHPAFGLKLWFKSQEQFKKQLRENSNPAKQPIESEANQTISLSAILVKRRIIIEIICKWHYTIEVKIFAPINKKTATYLNLLVTRNGMVAKYFPELLALDLERYLDCRVNVLDKEAVANDSCITWLNKQPLLCFDNMIFENLYNSEIPLLKKITCHINTDHLWHNFYGNSMVYTRENIALTDEDLATPTFNSNASFFCPETNKINQERQKLAFRLDQILAKTQAEKGPGIREYLLEDGTYTPEQADQEIAKSFMRSKSNLLKKFDQLLLETNDPVKARKAILRQPFSAEELEEMKAKLGDDIKYIL